MNRSFPVVVAGAALAFPSVGQQEVPVIGDRQVVTTGLHIADGDPPIVNEPQIIATIVDDEWVFIAMWQVGDVPGFGQIEDPVRLEYKVGSINQTTGDILWGPEQTIDLPSNGLGARDPAITVFDDDPILLGEIGDRLAAAGVFLNQSAESFPYVVRTPENSTDFTQLTGFDTAADVEAAFVRLQQLSPDEFDELKSKNDLYLFARALDDGSNGIVTGQLIQRFSSSGGAAWTPWAGMVDVFNNNEPILGFPSQPAGFEAGRGLVAYMDDQATKIGAMNGLWDGGTSRIEFIQSSLNITPNIVLGNEPDYFAASRNYLAGDFEIGPFTDLAIGRGPQGQWYSYIVYHDLAGSPQGNDGDFNVYLMRGEWDGVNEEWIWPTQGWPKKINSDNLGVKSDQFMPTVCVDADDRVHIAWYDTRHHLKNPGQDVTIALYYAYSEDGGDTFTQFMVDQEAIKTGYLNNPNTIGDRIDIVPRLTSDSTKGVVIVYTGTAHPRQQPPIGIESFGGGFETPQDDELIWSQRIDWVILP